MTKNNFVKIVPKRTVIIGAKGFVGQSICKVLKNDNMPILELSRNEVDFKKPEASLKLQSLLDQDDFIIIAAAEAPVKNNAMLLNNINIMKIIIDSILKKNIKRVVYVSSDAVYSDCKNNLIEKSPVEPQSLHGIMHLTREIMLKQLEHIQLSIIRPTLIYGFKDPHNGYGPNQFFRLASLKKNITLFGKGEELRDHVSINDVSKLIAKVTFSNFEGILNIASGKVISFKDIAKFIQKSYVNKINIIETERVGKMPHDGYRSFNIDKTHSLFPNFKITTVESGLKSYFDNISQ